MSVLELPRYRRIETASAAQISSVENFEVFPAEAVITEEEPKEKGLIEKAKDVITGKNKPGKNVEIKKEKMVRIKFDGTAFVLEMTSAKAKTLKVAPGRFYVIGSYGKESTRSTEFFLKNYSAMGV